MTDLIYSIEIIRIFSEACNSELSVECKQALDNCRSVLRKCSEISHNECDKCQNYKRVIKKLYKVALFNDFSYIDEIANYL